MNNITITKAIRNVADHISSLYEQDLIEVISDWIKEHIDELSDDFKEGAIREIFKDNEDYLSIDYRDSILVDYIVNAVLNKDF